MTPALTARKLGMIHRIRLVCCPSPGFIVLPDEDAPVAGATLFAESGCMNCHTYLGAGSSNLGAPDLSEEGAKGRGIQWQIDHLKNPASKTPGSPMPSFAQLGDENLTKIATFLEASKGAK